MAKNDIIVFDSLNGAIPRVRWAALTAAATFVAGEPVVQVAAGTLSECGSDPTGDNVAGIAVSSGDTVGATDANGTFRWKIGAFTPGTGYPVAGDLVPFVVPNENTLFATKNWDATTGGFGDTPATTNIGDGAGLQLVSGTWGLALGATNNTCRVVDLLDANFNPTAFSGGTAVWVVFTINAYQSASPTSVADAS